MQAPTREVMDFVHLFYMGTAGLSCIGISYYVRRAVKALDRLAGIE